MFRFIAILIIASAPVFAEELNREEVQKCISDSLLLKEGLDANNAEHRELQQHQVRLGDQHQQLTHFQQQIQRLNERLKTCSDGCNHIEAKRRNLMKKFDDGTEAYKRESESYKKQLALYQTTLETHQTTYAAYEQRCLQKEVTGLDYSRYCNDGNHSAPFCQKR